MKTNFKKHSIKVAVVLVAAFALVVGLTVNGYAATDTANATATIIAPISITADVDLDFGKFVAGGAGTVVMPADGTARSKTGAAVVLSSLDNGNRAQFTVTGDSGATYAITLPSDGVVTITDGVITTMNVDTFVSSPTVGAGGTLTGGTETLYVGATLGVAGTEAQGSYTGTFDVTVEYN